MSFDNVNVTCSRSFDVYDHDHSYTRYLRDSAPGYTHPEHPSCPRVHGPLAGIQAY